MTPAEAKAKIEAVVELIASRTMGENDGDDLRARGEAYAKLLVKSGMVASARYDHATGEVHAVPLAYPEKITLDVKVTPADLTALWDAARATLTAPVDIELLRLAREGHVNRDAIVAGLVPSCPACADDDDWSICEFAKPEAVAQRDAIRKLHAALKEGGAT